MRISFPNFHTRYPPVSDEQYSYLLGLRGLFVIQSFLWVFLQAFAPGTVKTIPQNQSSRPSQTIVRNSLSVLFWNADIIYSFFILLSARIICVPFIKESSKSNFAGIVFRRGIRLWFPTAVTLAVVKAILSQIGTEYIDRFKEVADNHSLRKPYVLPNVLAYFNSVFNLFWVTRDFAKSAGNLAFPSQVLWIVNVVYMQSYTVYMTMLIIPYTRNSWRVKAAILFIVTAWWVQSWAWYSITGLIIADMVMNMDFKRKAQRGIPFQFLMRKPTRCPSWIAYFLLMAAGLAMQYIWVTWRPQFANAEIIAHAGLYYTGDLNKIYDASEPQARADAYCFLLGLLLMVETYDFPQRLLRNSVLIYLGKRSFSWFLVQGAVIYVAGIKLCLHLTSRRTWSTDGSIVASLFVCLGVVIVVGEVFYRLIDCPSRSMAYRMYDWIRK